MEQSLFRRYVLDKFILLYEDVSDKYLSKIRRKKLTNTDFTIISNNCWGGTYIDDMVFRITALLWVYIFLLMTI